MNQPVKITAFVVRDKKQKDQILCGYFDCIVSGVKLSGCSLVRTANGGFVVYPPRVKDETAAAYQNVSFVESATMAAITGEARKAYKTFFGKFPDFGRLGDPNAPINKRTRTEDPVAQPADDEFRAGLNSFLDVGAT